MWESLWYEGLRSNHNDNQPRDLGYQNTSATLTFFFLKSRPQCFISRAMSSWVKVKRSGHGGQKVVRAAGVRYNTAGLWCWLHHACRTILKVLALTPQVTLGAAQGPPWRYINPSSCKFQPRDLSPYGMSRLEAQLGTPSCFSMSSLLSAESNFF